MGERLRQTLGQELNPMPTVSVEAGHSYTAEQIKTLMKTGNHRRVVAGVYQGFSRKSIVAFLQRIKGDKSKSADGTPFESTGYIPSADDLKRPVAEVVKDINERRVAPGKFTTSKKSDTPDITVAALSKALDEHPQLIPAINGALGYVRKVDANLLK